MSQTIPEKELLEFLDDIERGNIALVAEVDPQVVYAGNVRYRADNGWTIVIFNDANEWDYIDSVTTSDGREIDSTKSIGWPSYLSTS